MMEIESAGKDEIISVFSCIKESNVFKARLMLLTFRAQAMLIIISQLYVFYQQSKCELRIEAMCQNGELARNAQCAFSLLRVY
jgi:hypothetical protein